MANIIQESKFGKKIGIFAGNAKVATQWLKPGVDLVAINSELELMVQYVKKNLHKLETLIYEP